MAPQRGRSISWKLGVFRSTIECCERNKDSRYIHTNFGRVQCKNHPSAYVANVKSQTHLYTTWKVDRRLYWFAFSPPPPCSHCQSPLCHYGTSGNAHVPGLKGNVGFRSWLYLSFVKRTGTLHAQPLVLKSQTLIFWKKNAWKSKSEIKKKRDVTTAKKKMIGNLVYIRVDPQITSFPLCLCCRLPSDCPICKWFSPWKSLPDQWLNIEDGRIAMGIVKGLAKHNRKPTCTRKTHGEFTWNSHDAR